MQYMHKGNVTSFMEKIQQNDQQDLSQSSQSKDKNERRHQNSVKKQLLNKGQKKREQNSLKGKWTQEEDKIYMEFLMQNRNKITSKSCRKNQKIYRQLSQALGHSRTPKQCRMHHLRMKRTTRSINTIVNFIQKKHTKLNGQIQEKKDPEFVPNTEANQQKINRGAIADKVNLQLNYPQFSVSIIKDSEVCICAFVDLSLLRVW